MSTREKENVRWRRMPAERPGQILQAALAVFGDQGFENARLEDVAERAHVSKGTIYNYFPSKEALFEEMVRNTLGDLLDLAETVNDELSAEESLREFITGVWYYVRSPAFETIYRLVMAELNRFPHLGDFYTQGVRDRIMDVSNRIVSRGMTTGEFRAMDVNAASRMLLSLLVKHGVWCSRRETWPDLAQRTDEQIVEEIMEFYLHGLRSDAAVQTTQRRQA